MARAKVATQIPLEISDFSRQKVFKVDNADSDATVGALLAEVIQKMNLPVNDGGQPVKYKARLEREGRHVHDSELIGDALQSGDRLTLQPDIIAGVS